MGYDGNPHLIHGGTAFVVPAVQKCQRLLLNTMTLQIVTEKVYTGQGVPISVVGVAQVKIGAKNEELLRTAAQLFLSKSEEEIKKVALETLEGHQRAIMGTMTIEEIYKDRKKFGKAVFEVASSDLINMGMTVVSYTIKDVRDELGYLYALGVSQTASVQKDARIGEAEAKMESTIKAAEAEESRITSRLGNDTEMAKAQRDFELKKASYDIEVFTTKAEAEKAFELQAAKTRQRITEEEMQVKVVERIQDIQVQEQEIERRRKELEATVMRPAEAEKYRLEKMAQANMKRMIMEAEAKAEAVKIKGQAEAFAIEARARAEAEQMAKKADAWKEYKDAALLEMLLEKLPSVAAEVARPLAQAKKITMVSTGNGQLGAAKLTGEVVDIMATLPAVIKDMTGVDLAQMMRSREQV